MQLKKSEPGISGNLNLLNAALDTDPTNPVLIEEVMSDQNSQPFFYFRVRIL